MLVENNSRTATTGFVNGLKLQISNLELDNIFLRNERNDTLKPSILIADFTFVISELLMQNIEFTKKNGLTDSAKKSRERLMYLMDCSELFNSISNQNSTLKLDNRSLCCEVQRLNKELKELKRQNNLSI